MKYGRAAYSGDEYTETYHPTDQGMGYIEAPQVTPEAGSLGGDKYTHTAYGMIAANRTTGGKNILFGSDFVHHQSIRIKISGATLRRSLSNDWCHASNPAYVEVELSEAQWATFVSSLNAGEGVPCTVRYKDGKNMPYLPTPESRADQFGKEMAAQLAEASAATAELRKLVDSGLNKKAARGLLTSIENTLNSNLAFVAEQFGEHMHTMTERAKTEINAYATNLITRAGLAAIAGAEGPLTLEHKNGDLP